MNRVLHEEHLNEAAWLWMERKDACDSAIHTIADVAVGPEERLLAHLDGLVLGGAPVAEGVLRPALVHDDPGVIAASAWVLLQAEDADRQSIVFDAFAAAEPAARGAIAAALALSARADVPRLTQLWDKGTEPERALALSVLARRSPAWVKAQLGPALRSGSALLVAAALRVAGTSPDRALLDPVQDALHHDDAQVRELAIAAGTALGSKNAWNECRRACMKPSGQSRILLALLATSADANDRAFVASKAQDPSSARNALWALGFAGDLPSVEVLLAALSVTETAKIAGEALSAITGVEIAGKLADSGKSAGPEAASVTDDDPPPVVRSEDFLRAPRAEAVVAWWARERTRFQPGVRYVHGMPRGRATLSAALAGAPTWRRHLLKLELTTELATEPTTTSSVAPVVDLADWAREQLRQLDPRAALGSGAPS